MLVLNEKEKLYYEQNARNLLITWGEKLLY